MRRLQFTAFVLAGLMLASAHGLAQELYVYPAKGQSQAQQDKDRYECHSWAVQQTGFDPSQPTSTAQGGSAPPQGGLVRGAARGAAVGAVGGAIAGNAGKGAAIGAGTGALIGGMRRADQRRQQQYQAASVSSDQRAAYNRAMTACLQGRGYTVN